MENKFLPALMLNQYFPDNPENVDRQFCWEVWLTYDYDQADRYFQAVIDSKNVKKAVPPPKTIEIDDTWLNDLLGAKHIRK